MIIVYNFTGLLWGLVGLAAGLVVALLANHPGWGILMASLIWMAVGWGKNVKSPPPIPSQPPPLPRRTPAPSVFYIPLRIWGVVTFLVALPSLFMKLPPSSADDPRHPYWVADLSGLSQEALSGDDVGLSTKIQLLVARQTNKLVDSRDFRVRTRIKGDRALILVTMADLRDIPQVNRTMLLDKIESFVKLERPDILKTYIGIQGLVLFGAIRSPDRTDVGKVVLDQYLLDFYDQPSSRPASRNSE